MTILAYIAVIYASSLLATVLLLRYLINGFALRKGDWICALIPGLNTLAVLFIMFLGLAIFTEYLLRKVAPETVRKALGI